MFSALLFVLLLTSGEGTASTNEDVLLSKTRQLTFEGLRSGEGYFNADGTAIIFQSERQEGNPFYQIYHMDLETGDTVRVSPGHGKTTCAWIHPDNERLLFASTHLDPQAVTRQKEELDLRASGKQRRYAWDYDEHFDLFEGKPGSTEYQQLTREKGYDAEALPCIHIPPHHPGKIVSTIISLHQSATKHRNRGNQTVGTLHMKSTESSHR